MIRQVAIERDLAESRIWARETEVRRNGARKRDRPSQTRRTGPPPGRRKPAADDRKRQGFRNLHHRSGRASRELERGRGAAFRLPGIRNHFPEASRSLSAGRPGRGDPRTRDRIRSRQGPRHRRALAYPQGRHQVLRQRRARSDLRRGVKAPTARATSASSFAPTNARSPSISGSASPPTAASSSVTHCGPSPAVTPPRQPGP